MGGKRPCAGCGNPLGDGEGVEAFGARFCATCFISDAAKFHRPLKPEDLALLKTIGRAADGFLPPELLSMVVAGFYRRATGKPEPPPAEELSRCIGEIQRLAIFANLGKLMTLLKTWQDTITEFVDGQQSEIRDTVKRLTDGE